MVFLGVLTYRHERGIKRPLWWTFWKSFKNGASLFPWWTLSWPKDSNEPSKRSKPPASCAATKFWKVTSPLCSPLMTNLSGRCCAWYQKYKDTAKWVQQRATKMKKKLEHLSNEGREMWECSAWRGGSGGSINTWREGAEKMKPCSFQWCPKDKAMGTDYNKEDDHTVKFHLKTKIN